MGQILARDKHEQDMKLPPTHNLPFCLMWPGPQASGTLLEMQDTWASTLQKYRCQVGPTPDTLNFTKANYVNSASQEVPPAVSRAYGAPAGAQHDRDPAQKDGDPTQHAPQN